MTQNRLRLHDLFRYYKALPHQAAAITELEEAILKKLPDILNRDQEWFKTWSQSGKQGDFPNTWDGVVAAATAAGAKFPELVAAQWACESGWGKYVSGTHNYFGQKGSGSGKSTQEFVNNQWITITADFIDFPDLLSSVTYLVNHWYKDYKNYKGCNNAATRDDAARWLKKEGYATDPDYAEKLICLMNDNAKKKPVDQKEVPESAKFTPDKPWSFKVTPNITYGELTLNEEERRFTKQQQCDTALELCRYLEKVRAHFGGKPIVITSGHRPPAINQRAGGSSRSEHLYNMDGVGAVDFYIAGADIYEVQEYCDNTWPFSLGYGAPKGFVHLGKRLGGPRIRWDY